MDDIEPLPSANMGTEAGSGAAVLAHPAGPGRAPEITLRQLRVFWTIAHSATLTKAAKQLSLAQPTLSQQLSKLESTVGIQLFERRSNEMTLTEAGAYLLPKAEQILRNIRELEDGLTEFGGGHRGVVHLSGVTSVLRVILPLAIRRMHQKFPEIDFDIHENAPAEILELLYARRINIGLVAANSIAEAGVGFLQVPVIDDPLVLAVPADIRLDQVYDLDADLDPEQRAVFGHSIQFNFGTPHTNRVKDWYDRVLPGHRAMIQCRNFEVAIGMVRAGLGVCLAPALSAVAGQRPLEGVRLYRVEEPPRRIVALVPSQYRRLEPYSTLLDILGEVGTEFVMPEILPTPPFLVSRP